MTNPKKPGRYRLTFRARDRGRNGEFWYYHGYARWDGKKWSMDTTHAVDWEKVD